KHINIPNICFSLDNSNNVRSHKYKKQRLKRGFDDSELWSLCNTISSFTIPRLKAFINIYSKACCAETEKLKHCKRLLRALILINRDDGSWIFTEKEQRQVDKGLKSFHKVFMMLWY